MTANENETPGPVVRGRKITAESVLRRAMLFARALGFVFLVYFVPDVLQELLGRAVAGGGFRALVIGTASPPWLAAGAILVAVAIAGAVVVGHARLGDGAAEPRRLLRWDRAWWRDTGSGFLLGGAAALLAIVPLLATGVARIGGVRAVGDEAVGAGALLLGILAKSAHEEMGFRGPAFRDLGRAISPPLAAAFLAGSFALMHGGNPAFGPRALLGTFLAGFALAGFVRARGDLAMAIGAHAGWNVVLGWVASAPVSGYSLPGRLVELELSASAGAEPWTGGAFGPEGGWSGIAALFLLGLFAWRLPRRTDDTEGSGPGA